MTETEQSPGVPGSAVPKNSRPNESDQSSENGGEGETMLAIALRYLEQGLRPIPCGSHGENPPGYFIKKCGNSLETALERWPKVPRLRTWKPFQSREPTEREVTDWWTKWPAANIALVTGPELTVVDCDSQEAYAWAREHLPYTPWKVQTSAEYKQHFYYRTNPDVEIRNSTENKLDTRGVAGYCIAGGSTHSTGAVYTNLIDDGVPCDSYIDLPMLSADHKQAIKTYQAVGTASDNVHALFHGASVKASDDDYTAPQPEGSRNTAMASYVGLLYRQGHPVVQATKKAFEVNRTYTPPMDDSEVLGIIENVANTHLNNTGMAVPATQADKIAAELAQIQDASDAIKAYDIVDFLDMEIPERRYLLKPIITERASLQIYSWRGVGKTHVAVGIGVALATGTEFLKWKADAPCRVAYLDGEMPAKAMQERWKRSENAKLLRDYPKNLIYIGNDLQDTGLPNLATAEGQQAIWPYIEDRQIVIVDNVSTLCRVSKENDADSWRVTQEWELMLRRKGIALVYIHHASKGGQQRGTSKKEDTLDTVIALRHSPDYEPKDGASFEVHYEKHRGFFGDDALPFSATLMSDGTWNTLDLEQSTAEKVVKLSDEGLTPKEIAEELGIHKSTVSRHLKARVVNSKDSGVLFE